MTYTCIQDSCGIVFDSSVAETRNITQLRPFWQHYCPKHRIAGQTLEATFRKLQDRYDQEHRWLEEAANEAGGVELDQVANTILKFKIESACVRMYTCTCSCHQENELCPECCNGSISSSTTIFGVSMKKGEL